jgi:hypothetical protein
VRTGDINGISFLSFHPTHILLDNKPEHQKHMSILAQDKAVLVILHHDVCIHDINRRAQTVNERERERERERRTLRLKMRNM